MLGPLVAGAGGARADGVGPRTETDDPVDCKYSPFVGVFLSFSPTLLTRARPMFIGIIEDDADGFFGAFSFILLPLLTEVSSSFEALLLVAPDACVTRSTLTTSKFSRPRGS